LSQLGVRIEVLDEETVILRNVPANSQFFNKPRTNLLFKKPEHGMPFLVGVDEDLEYHGGDGTLSRLFAAGCTRSGWRFFPIGQSRPNDFEQVLEQALEAIGFDGREPVIPPAGPLAGSKSQPGLLAAVGKNLTELVRSGPTEVTCGREREITEVTACLLRWGQERLAVIEGDSGVGKSNLLHAVAHLLAEVRPEINLVCADLGCLLAGCLFDGERENLLARLLREAAASPAIVLALEHFDLVSDEVPHGGFLVTEAMNAGLRLVGTAHSAHRLHLDPILARHLSVVRLEEPTRAETAAILMALRGPISAHHRVEIDELLLQTCMSAAQPLVGHFPAKAIALLDAAAARAALSGATAIGPDDIHFVAHCYRWTEQ
jgi:ATP-dependent Clp protease ATP-binding subunit ClpA